jgi:hypothetical protein
MVCLVFLLLPKVDSNLRLSMRRNILKMPTMQPPGGKVCPWEAINVGAMGNAF